MTEFDRVVERKNTDCLKWDCQGGDFIPMWVADMDFKAPQPVLDAVGKRLSHGVFGYGTIWKQAKKSIANHYRKLYGIEIKEEWIVLISSVMPGANIACRAAGGGILYSAPMYTHIRSLPKEVHADAAEVPMKMDNMIYSMDFDALEKAVSEETKILILCNPHNPVGRVFSRDELEEAAAFAEKHNLIIISDEIHCELVFDKPHIPFFGVNDWARENSIVLSSAGKICNIPGLPSGFAVIPNETLRDKFNDISRGLFDIPNVLAIEALNAAYNGSCDEWKESLRSYLKGNRDYMEKRFAAMNIPVTHCEGTYLAWLDLRRENIENPWQFFREKAGVNFNDGLDYGEAGRGFLRLNFGCPRAQLEKALNAVERAVEENRKKNRK